MALGGIMALKEKLKLWYKISQKETVKIPVL